MVANLLFRFLVLNILLSLSSPCVLQAQPDQDSQPAYSAEDLKDLKAIHSILLTGTVSTWLNLPHPPYEPVSTVQMKLQDAGFHVVFDPAKAHDAIMEMQYREIPSGTFRILEQGISVRFKTSVYHPRMGLIFSNHFEAEPNEISIFSLYWEAINNLEENPFYFYQGEILKGWLLDQTDAGAVLIHMLRRPYTDKGYQEPVERPGLAAVRKGARLNAIREIGGLKNPETQETLWELTQLAVPEERKIAVDVLGRLGDSSFIPKLSHIAETDLDPNVQAAAEDAILAIQAP